MSDGGAALQMRHKVMIGNDTIHYASNVQDPSEVMIRRPLTTRCGIVQRDGEFGLADVDFDATMRVACRECRALCFVDDLHAAIIEHRQASRRPTALSRVEVGLDLAAAMAVSRRVFEMMTGPAIAFDGSARRRLFGVDVHGSDTLDGDAWQLVDADERTVGEGKL